jgi:hypothetical protein
MTNVLLELSASISESRLAQMTRDLSRDISRVGITARLVEAPPAPDERGDAVTLGQIAFELISGGAVTALIGCLRAYLSSERSLNIKLTRQDGSQIEVTSHNVDSAAVERALATATSARPA